MNLCQCTGPASQIPILVTAPPAKKQTYMNDFIQLHSFNDLSP